MINANAYYTVQAWMVNDLELHGNELALYAIIYGFSQDGRSEFSGSISYIMEWLGCSRPTATKTIANLVSKGLIEKKTVTNGIDPNAYKAVLPAPVGSKETLPGVVKNFSGGSKETLPNNYIDNNTDNYLDKDKADAAASPAPAPAEKPKKEKPTKHKHGQYGHVLLSQAEKTTLESEYGPDLAAAAIQHLDEYIEEKGYKSKSHYLAIRRWVVAAVLERENRPTRPQAGCWSPGPVGPNGIKTGTGTDRDGLF